MLPLLALVPKPHSDVDWNQLQTLCPQLVVLGETEQDATFHEEGTVGIHTRMAVDHLITCSAYEAVSEHDRQTLFLATLFHDIAKPSRTKYIDGKLRSIGHPSRGAIDTRAFLWKQGFPREQRERICRIIENHHKPIFAFETDQVHSAEFLVRLLSQTLNIQNFLTVCQADINGRICATKYKQSALDSIELFRLLAEEENCLTQPYQFLRPQTKVKYFRDPERVYPQAPLYPPQGSKVTMLSGLPACGKNYWVEQNYPDMPVVSFDDTRNLLGLDYGDNEGKVAQATVETARAYLRDKQAFIWNATNITWLQRMKVQDLVFKYDAELCIVGLETGYKTMLQRNAARPYASYVPEAVIQNMILKWDPPTTSEAHYITYVTT